MKIIGSAEEARGLAQAIVIRTRNVFDLANTIRENLRTLQGSFQDEGFNEYNDIIIKIYNSIKNHLDDVKALEIALNAYADVLERRN